MTGLPESTVFFCRWFLFSESNHGSEAEPRALKLDLEVVLDGALGHVEAAALVEGAEPKPAHWEHPQIHAVEGVLGASVAQVMDVGLGFHGPVVAAGSARKANLGDGSLDPSTRSGGRPHRGCAGGIQVQGPGLQAQIEAQPGIRFTDELDGPD